MKVEIEIDEKKYGLLCCQHDVDEAMKLLHDLYSMIYIEAKYDPYSEETEKYANRLLPGIQRLNEILKFKK